MKSWIVVGLSISFSVHAQTLNYDAVKAVEANAFKCNDDDGIQLKNFTILGLDIIPRDYIASIDCRKFMRDAYFEGSKTLFKFFNQVVELTNPQGFAHLLAFPTKFTFDDIVLVKAALEKLKVKLDTPDARMIIALGDVEGRLKWGGERIESLSATEYIEELKVLTTQCTSISNIEFTSPFDSRKLRLADEAMKLELLAQKTAFRDLQAAAQELASNLLLLTQKTTLESWVNTSHKSQLSTLQLLNMTGRSAQLALVLVGQIKSEMELPAVLSIRDEAVRKDAIHEVAKRYGQDRRPKIEKNECPMVLGAILWERDKAVSEELTGLFNLNCNHLDFAEGPVEFTGDFSRDLNKAFRTGPLGNAEDFLRQAEKNCRVDGNIERLAKLKIPAIALTQRFDSALKTGCRSVAVVWGQQLIESWNLDHALRAMPEESDEKVRADVFRDLLTGMKPEQRVVSETTLALAKAKAGSSAERMLKIVRRHENNEIAQRQLIDQSENDSDEIISLNWWNGVKIEIDASRVTLTQQKLIDSIRTAVNPQELPFPLSQAFVKVQEESRPLRPQDQNAYERSVNEFLIERTGEMLESMAAAKMHLDRIIDRGGIQNPYNSTATLVLDILLRGRVQCSSGTDFILLHTARLAGLSDSGKFAVVINKTGHILPGVVDTKTKTIDGIESTVAGKGRVSVPLHNTTLPDNHVVILADDYLLSKILASVLRDPNSVRLALMARAEAVLGIKQGKIIETPKSGSGEPETDGLNASIFAFGRISVPTGDLPRAHMDGVPADINAERLAELGRPRIPATGIGLSRFPEVNETKKPENTPVVQPRPMMPVASARLDASAHLLESIIREIRSAGLNLGEFGVIQSDKIVDEIARALTAYPAFRAEMLKSIARSEAVIVDLAPNGGPGGTILSQTDSVMQKNFRKVLLKEAELILWERQHRKITPIGVVYEDVEITILGKTGEELEYQFLRDGRPPLDSSPLAPRPRLIVQVLWREEETVRVVEFHLDLTSYVSWQKVGGPTFKIPLKNQLIGAPEVHNPEL